MKIEVAATAGFCFGVNRAIELIYSLLDKGEHVCTLGPIIHNPQMVEALRQRGVETVDCPEDTPPDSTLVIRSHGVGSDVIDTLERLRIKYVDATCPFVAKIHRIVSKASIAGDTILIAGDAGHPEVLGIIGHCHGLSYVFRNEDELRELIKNVPSLLTQNVSIVSQTTHSSAIFENCREKIIKKLFTHATVFDTICNATFERQREAVSLSEKSDLMVIIGGRQSSNTAKLRDVCSENCRTILIETADELSTEDFKGAVTVGVTAGASTPADIIKEVLKTMSDNINNEMNENFEEMLEESFKNSNSNGKIVQGTVERITATEVYVDVGRKQFGIVALDDLTDDPSAKPEDIVKVGDKLDLVIMRTNDQEGLIYLSKKLAEIPKSWDDVRSALENGTVLSGTVTKTVKGGITVNYKSLRVFIPRSMATLSRNEDVEALVGKKVDFKVIEVNDEKRNIIGSIRLVLTEAKKAAEEKFWSTAEVGAKYHGVVKSLTSYGAFVDIGGIDGMIHISQLSWERLKTPADILSVGDEVDVYIKSLDVEKKKISLGYKDPDANPWQILKNDYTIGCEVEGKVVNLTAFGAFVNILPSIDGLVHISQIAQTRVENPADVLSVGQTVKAILTEVDFDKKRVSLSIRKYLDIVSPLSDASAEEISEEDSAETTEE